METIFDKHLPWWAVLLVIGGIAGFVALFPSQKKSSNRAAKTPPPRIATFERLEYEIKRTLGSSNRNQEKFAAKDSDGTIVVGFAIDDNLSNGWVKDGAKEDITKILKAIQNSNYPYKEISIFGTFKLVDKYGNSEEEMVLKTSYTPDTVNKINWDNFLYDNIYDIADSVWFHPAFR